MYVYTYTVHTVRARARAREKDKVVRSNFPPLSKNALTHATHVELALSTRV